MNQNEAFNQIVLRFIDAYVELHLEINSTIVMAQFPIARTKVSSLMTRYLEDKPSNLRYVAARQRYLKGLSFERQFLEKEQSALAYLQAIELAYKPYTDAKE
ncbi:hypothetical protein H8F18_16480 [Vibrio fluvialis]|uniref:DNA-binding transcriptional repressor CapW winged helix-turn-helix domain-containing protein n=1 Tax=Vibrio cholerae TaxID=666 RepID=A0A7Z7VN53_VIBCL|nr:MULTISPECIES: hypothetical protein [Vibrio]MBL4244024.1 hypothetical protein [Vibrio fluvialis]MBL4252940.1 hypothetical protein [Vibrio fluvialis]PNV69622.1 hypothetical protein C1Y48_17310 [Vibrio cholerae]TBM40592.1 hypothetical protein EYB64_14260 [Vibrio cholerae]BEI26103.1 hypothetical protein KKIDH5335_44350 [Vibrio fluvialis]